MYRFRSAFARHPILLTANGIAFLPILTLGEILRTSDRSITVRVDQYGLAVEHWIFVKIGKLALYAKIALVHVRNFEKIKKTTRKSMRKSMRKREKEGKEWPRLAGKRERFALLFSSAPPHVVPEMVNISKTNKCVRFLPQVFISDISNFPIFLT